VEADRLSFARIAPFSIDHLFLMEKHVMIVVGGDEAISFPRGLDHFNLPCS
jgi:hypothetical protein